MASVVLVLARYEHGYVNGQHHGLKSSQLPSRVDAGIVRIIADIDGLAGEAGHGVCMYQCRQAEVRVAQRG